MTTDTSIELWMTDPDAAAGASAADSGTLQPWADPADVCRDYPADHLPNVATLEENFGWPLDGSRDLMPDDPTRYDWGIWSGSLEDGTMDRTIDVSLEGPCSSTGITLGFVGGLPALVRVRWYDGEGGLLLEREGQPTEELWFCDGLVEDYRRVTIQLIGMREAGRWLRLHSILFGHLETIDRARITRAILTEDTDPTLETLPVSTLELSFHTADDRFRMLAPGTLYRAFRRRQRADVWKEIDGARQRAFVLYLAELGGVEDAVTALTFEDILGVLDRETFDGGMYAQTPAEEILDAMGIRYELDDSLAGRTVTGHLPVQSKRQSLRDLCFALGCRAETSRGYVRLIPEETEAAAVIGADRRITGHKLKQEDLITNVEVTGHSWTLVKQEEGETLPTLASGTYPVGLHRIEFSSPGIWKVIENGAWVVRDHVNYVVIDVRREDEAEVEVLGWEYRDSTTLCSAALDRIPAGTDHQTKEYAVGALLDPAGAQAAAERLLAYHRKRFTDKGDLLPGWERAGNAVLLETPWGGRLAGRIERLVTDLYNGCIQTATVRGESAE